MQEELKALGAAGVIAYGEFPDQAAAAAGSQATHQHLTEAQLDLHCCSLVCPWKWCWQRVGLAGKGEWGTVPEAAACQSVGFLGPQAGNIKSL